LKKKKILLIGGTGGIGNVLGDFLSKSYFLISASRSRPNYECQYLYLDLSNQKSIKDFCISYKNKFKNIEGLIFNSGKSIAANNKYSGRMQDPKIFNELININLLSFYELIYEIEPCISNKSSIILISSIGAHYSFPQNPGYQVSKAGLESISRCLSYDLAPREIRVNSLALGYFKTDMTKSSYEDKNLRLIRESNTLLNRWGEPEEVTGIVNLLLSDNSSYITGSTIFVDGGWHSKGL
tara:strand:+ start:724 stop:1440 length:717 start_codon:yes stop_codon:yes gene_type:complete